MNFVRKDVALLLLFLPSLFGFSALSLITCQSWNTLQRSSGVQQCTNKFSTNPYHYLRKSCIQMKQQSGSDFLGWASSQGIQCDSLTLSSFDGIRGIGVDTTHSGEKTILTVPESKVLRVLAQSTILPESLEKENFVSEKVHHF